MNMEVCLNFLSDLQVHQKPSLTLEKVSRELENIWQIWYDVIIGSCSFWQNNYFQLAGKHL